MLTIILMYCSSLSICSVNWTRLFTTQPSWTTWPAVTRAVNWWPLVAGTSLPPRGTASPFRKIRAGRGQWTSPFYNSLEMVKILCFIWEIFRRQKKELHPLISFFWAHTVHIVLASDSLKELCKAQLFSEISPHPKKSQLEISFS